MLRDEPILGQHGDICIEKISAGRTYQLTMPKDLARSDRLKVAAGGRWHRESKTWRVSATRAADLHRWLNAETGGDTAEFEAAAQRVREERALEQARQQAAAEKQHIEFQAAKAAEAKRQAEARAVADAERKAVAAAAEAKAAAMKPIIEKVLVKLATATEFVKIEAKEVLGVGGGRPTAVAIDDETGIKVDASPMLEVTEEQSSRRVILFNVRVPKAEGITVHVKYWWNRERTCEIG